MNTPLRKLLCIINSMKHFGEKPCLCPKYCLYMFFIFKWGYAQNSSPNGLKNLNINPTTLNLIGQKEGSSLQYMGTGDHFLHITPVAQTMRATMNKWDLLKLRSFGKANELIPLRRDISKKSTIHSPCSYYW